MGLMKELAELNAIYQKMSTQEVDEAMVVTNADKKGNTPAYQNFKKGMKGKDGKPMYKAADHMKEEEVIDEKMNAGLKAYLDKKKGKKENGDKEENGNGNGNGNGKKNGKGGKPDFLDLDKDGNKTEPMKSAAKSKKEETEYNYVNQYLENAPRMQKGAMAYDGPNKAASEAKDRVMAKTKAKRKKPTVTIDKPDSLVSMRVSKESFDKLIESGKFSDLELQRFLFDAFEEGYQRNPEKDPQNKPYREKSKAERMADPDRGINSPAFKKFMADRGM